MATGMTPNSCAFELISLTWVTEPQHTLRLNRQSPISMLENKDRLRDDRKPRPI
jgi:hypothetical protein